MRINLLKDEIDGLAPAQEMINLSCVKVEFEAKEWRINNIYFDFEVPFELEVYDIEIVVFKQLFYICKSVA